MLPQRKAKAKAKLPEIMPYDWGSIEPPNDGQLVQYEKVRPLFKVLINIKVDFYVEAAL